MLFTSVFFSPSLVAFVSLDLLFSLKGLSVNCSSQFYFFSVLVTCSLEISLVECSILKPAL